MPQLSRRYLQCHYCGKRSNQKWAVYIRSWKCNFCEAFNYLDENGQITDPPVREANKQSSPQYGRNARSTQSPDLSPQGNDIFCRTCLSNQHVVRQLLADYLPDTSDPEYSKFLGNIENYKKELETRYPQVCANCAPRVNERLKQTKFVARADNLRRGLAKKKPLLYAPEWRLWDWRRVLVFVGGVMWWTSMLGQATWHILGVLPPAQKQMRMRNTSWYGQYACAAAALASREMQTSCLDATSSAAWLALKLGLLSFWWNNQLSKKLYSRERRLHGVVGYLMVQVLNLSIRASALFMLEHPDWIPAEVPAKGVHGAMLAFIVFITLISMTTVKLQVPRKPNLTDHHPVQVDPAATKLAYQTHVSPVASQTASFSASFPISALSKTPKATTPPRLQMQVAQYEEEDNEMDWTPTGPSQYTQFNHQPVPEYRRPDGPNPFRGTLPPAPKAPAHKARNPKPFLPASQDKKQNFMNQIRGEIRGATGSPTSDDEDGAFSFGGSKKSNAGFMLGPSNMRDYQAESAASGLEDLFNSAFTINAAKPTQVQSDAQPPKQEKEKGFVIDGETVRENVMVMRAATGFVALVVLCFAVAVGMGWINPKSAIESLLYEKEVVHEVHDVMEDLVEDYIGT